MKFQTLRNNNRKWFIGAVVFIAVLSTLVLNTSKANYRTEQRIPLVRGTFSYKLGDFNVIYILKKDENGKYDTVDTIPDGYELNKEMSYCKRDGEKLDVTMDYNSETKTFTVSPVTNKVTKCYLYFDVVNAKSQILAGKTISERTDFSQVLTTDTTGTIYKAEDNDGESYYFAGATDDNWVKFAGFYWRIIRINGDGTLRLIYSGSEETGPVTIGESTQIGTSAFNTSYDDNAYVGYMYKTGELHGLETSSTIKGALEPWYNKNIVVKNFDQYVDVNAGFCGDRTLAEGSGQDAIYTEYGAHNRLVENKQPSLKCLNENDLYTKKGANKGNKQLGQPVGLITADEVAYAGSGNGFHNGAYYLNSNQRYWSMSPCTLNHYGLSLTFSITEAGAISGGYVIDLFSIRPVINLKADTIFSSGNGTSSEPFLVE